MLKYWSKTLIYFKYKTSFRFVCKECNYFLDWRWSYNFFYDTSIHIQLLVWCGISMHVCVYGSMCVFSDEHRYVPWCVCVRVRVCLVWDQLHCGPYVSNHRGPLTLMTWGGPQGYHGNREWGHKEIFRSEALSQIWTVSSLSRLCFIPPLARLRSTPWLEPRSVRSSINHRNECDEKYSWLLVDYRMDIP